jgi:hypothetical protein
VCAAAVPALLLTGCSSGGGSDSGKDPSASASSAGAGSDGGKGTDGAPAAAKFRTLPDACGSVSAGTVTALVPKAKAAAGKPAQSDDTTVRGGCSWTGNGKDGYQYRWLSVTFQRFTPAAGTSAEDQAKGRFTDQAAQLGKAKGATSTPVSGVGDQAVSVAAKATVAKVTSQNDTVLVRTGNVVVIVEYDGAGLAGKKNPSAATITAGALRAAKDAVAAVATGKPATPAEPSPTAKVKPSGKPSATAKNTPSSKPSGKPSSTAGDKKD